MSRKRVIIGQSEWAIGDDQNADDITSQIKTALEGGTVAELVLLDGADRPVTVYINGKVVETVVIDLDMGPRPMEISG